MIPLEVCVDGPAGLMAAVRGGASRIELCSALALGGLTPSPGFMRLAATVGVETWPILRPHPGPFVHDAADLAVIAGDLEAAAAAGLPGVVVGANRPDGTLDLPVLETIAGRARALGLRLALHRAFDLVPDQPAALEQAIGLGFERILTSGAARTAAEGVERIAALVRQAAGRVSLMPGAGLTPDTLAEVMRRTGAPEAHGSCGRPVRNPGFAPAHGARAEALGFIGPTDRETDEGAVAAMVAILAGVAAERRGGQGSGAA